MEHYTTIVQSEKLLELGLNPETADMHYVLIGDIDSGNIICSDICPLEIGKPYNKLTLPCWSLGALLEVKPRMIEVLKEDLPFYFFQSESEWIFQYGYPSEIDNSIIITGSTPIEAAYSMAVWLLENGFIKKETKTFSE